MQTSPPPNNTPTPFALAAVSDRRSQPRLSAEIVGLDVDARLSLGVHVRVMNVSNGGALLELQEWIRPGTRSELRLSKTNEGQGPEKLAAQGQIVRCWVHRLSPLRYRAALVFKAAPPKSPGTPPANEENLTVLLERPA